MGLWGYGVMGLWGLGFRVRSEASRFRVEGFQVSYRTHRNPKPENPRTLEP